MVALFTACGSCSGSGSIDSPRSRMIGSGKYTERIEWVTPVPCPACAGSGLELATIAARPIDLDSMDRTEHGDAPFVAPYDPIAF